MVSAMFSYRTSGCSGTNTEFRSIIGGALMSFLPTTNKSGVLAGIYLVNAVVAPLAVFYNVGFRSLKARKKTS